MFIDNIGVCTLGVDVTLAPLREMNTERIFFGLASHCPMTTGKKRPVDEPAKIAIARQLSNRCDDEHNLLLLLRARTLSHCMSLYLALKFCKINHQRSPGMRLK
jgi:hypothetical protein